MANGQNFYDDQDFRTVGNLSQLQSGQALAYGDQAARYADPFMQERGKYQKQLSDLMENPGSFASSPAYQFSYNQGLEALNRKGNIRSGAKLADLMKYGQGFAGQQYFNQAKLLSDLATSGSSPESAGLSYARGAGRSQDYAQVAAAAKVIGRQQNRGGGLPSGGYSGDNMLNDALARQNAQLADNQRNFGYGTNSGYGNTGYTGGFSDSYGSGYGNTYFPSSMKGTGSISSDYGTYDFGSSKPNDSFYTPSYDSWGAGNDWDYGGYDDYWDY